MKIISPRSKHPFLRYLLLLCILLTMGAAYWQYFDQRMNVIFSRNLSDTDNLLTKDEEQSLLRIMASFKKQFGFEVKVGVNADIVHEATSSGHAVFLNIGVKPAIAEIVLPVVVQKAIGKNSLQTITDKTSVCLKIYPPAVCIFNTIQDLSEALRH